MEIALHKFWNRIVREYQLKTSFLSTAIFFFIAHGYGMVIYAPSHDATMVVSCDDYYQYTYGRWAVPYYYEYIRHRINTNWFNIIVCCIAIALTVALISNLLKLGRWQTIMVAGVLSVNITLICQFATFIQGADTEGISVLLAVLLVFLVDKYKNSLIKLVGSLCLCVSMGFYGANIDVAIGLILIIIIIRALNEEYDFKSYAKYGFMQLLYLGVGCIFYVLATKFFEYRTGIGMGGGYNGPGRLLGMSKRELVLGLISGMGDAYRYMYKYFLAPLSSRVEWVYALLFVLAMVLFVWQCVKIRKNWVAIVEAVGALLLFTLGINALLALSMGAIHRIMVYSYNMVLVLIIALAAMATINDIHYIIKSAVSVLLCVYLFMNSLFANDVYFYKQRVYEKSYLAAYEVYLDVMDMEGFDPATTDIYIVDNGTDEDNFGYNNELVEQIIYEGAKESGLVNSAFTHPITIGWFYYFVYGINLRWEVDESYYDNAKVQKMPCYPYDGYIDWVDDSLVVKLSR
ncbi:MAG: glucosyltransferase domain-containing protein [Pseudobutyrivibrio sp.]|nr:glucosyltransferase domain-containing protein [Pseudobutyrivibrio sp.]